MMMSGKNRFPFTETQRQELEHQALIFKYMVSGIPVPTDLLFTVRRSLDSPKLFPHNPQHIKWSCFPMGDGRKLDPEPGRCRRTDGKKWRCSKDAFPESKYCERHMHRGKNRSRKPVENIVTVTTTTSNGSNPNPNPTVASANHLQHYPFLSSSSSKSHGVGFSLEDDTTTNLLLDSASYSHSNTDNRGNRYVYGLKEEVDEHAFCSEPSGTIRSFSSSSMNDQWQFAPLAVSSSTYSKQRSCSVLETGCSYLELQNLSRDSTMENEHSQKTIHHFFDEWPIKNTRDL